MTADEALARARHGDLDGLAGDRRLVAEAVERLAADGRGEAALELVGRTWRIWFTRGDLEAGGALANRALEAAGSRADSVWLNRTLYADGLFAFRAGEQERSRARNAQALAAARSVGDRRGECDALTGLARVALRDGEYGEVVRLSGEARATAREAGDAGAEAAPLHLEAAGRRLEGDYESARGCYLESLELNRRLGNAAWVAMEQHNLGWVALHLGDVAEAEERFAQALAGRPAEDAYGQAWADLNTAAVAVERGALAEARRRLALGTAALQDLGSAPDPDDQAELDWLRGRIPPP